MRRGKVSLWTEMKTPPCPLHFTLSLFLHVPPSFTVYIKIFWANQSSRTPAQQRRISSQLCAVRAQQNAIFLTLYCVVLPHSETNCYTLLRWNQNSRLLKLSSTENDSLFVIYLTLCLSKHGSFPFFHRTQKADILKTAGSSLQLMKTTSLKIMQKKHESIIKVVVMTAEDKHLVWPVNRN